MQEKRFSLAFAVRYSRLHAELNFNPAFLACNNRRFKLTVAGVKQQSLIAFTRAQHRAQIVGTVGGKLNMSAAAKCGLKVKARDSHGVSATSLR